MPPKTHRDTVQLAACDPDTGSDSSVTMGWSEPASVRAELELSPDGIRVCGVCGRTLPLHELRVKDISRGLYRTTCKACQRAYAKQHYLDNRATYLAKASERDSLMRDRFAALILAYSEQHGCVDCGTKDAAILEFDHRDRPAKVAAISTLMNCSHGALSSPRSTSATCGARTVTVAAQRGSSTTSDGKRSLPKPRSIDTTRVWRKGSAQPSQG
jgi:hypothetical protein